MAIAFDNSQTLTTVTGPASTLSQSYTCSGANRILFACIFGDGTSDVLSGGTVSYGGVNMTLQLSQGSAAPPSGNGIRWIYVYSLVGPASGSNTFAVNASANFDFCGGTLASYTGVIGVNIDGFAAGASSGGTSLSVARASANDQAWAICMGIGFISGHHLVLSSGSPNTPTTRSTLNDNVATFDSNGAISPANTFQSFVMAEDNSGVSNFGGIVGCFDPGVQPVVVGTTPIIFPGNTGLVRATRIVGY